MGDVIRINRIGVVVILFLIGQAILGFRWGSRMEANVASLTSLAEANKSELTKQIDKLEASINSGMMLRYTSVDATRDKELYLQLLTAINRRIDLNEKRIERMESGFKFEPTAP